MKKSIYSILIHKIIFIAVLFSTSIINSNAQTNKHTKQKGEIIYHVFQRSFFDSNGDLHGDLNGLRQKLDYLQNLGVTSILLLPLYEADCYHNYFANNFEKIDSKYGTMNDYIALVKEIHKRGMKIYLDMETQYVTEKHLWWKDAVGNLKSPYSNYILFKDEAHTIPETMVFNLTELNSYDGSKIKVTTVNLKNKDVLNYNIKLFSFFTDPNNDGKFDDGADGFRLDHTMDHLDKKPTLTNLFNDFWLPLIQKIKSINGNIKFMAEQADWSDFGFEYFKKADIDRVFAFGLTYAILTFNKDKIVKLADTILHSTPKGKEQIVFIENHDMDRSVTVLKNDSSKQRVAAALLLLIGGVPSIYYGQEIGMRGHGGFGVFGNTDGNDIPMREAFEWYKSGTVGKGMAIWYKNTGPWWGHTNIKPNDGISLEEEQNNKNSLFNFYKKIINLRQNNIALSTGNYQNTENDNNNVFSFTREAEKNKVLVAVNLSNQNQTVNLKSSNAKYIPLYGKAKINNNNFQLNPYEIMVWAIQ